MNSDKLMDIDQYYLFYEQLQNFHSMINLDSLDPDWQFASKHGRASLVGIPSQKSKNNNSTLNSQICPCCLQYIYKDPVPLCTNPKQLQFLGFGFPLFYIFLKNCMILLLISICSYNAISLKKSFEYTQLVCSQIADSTSNTTVLHRVLSETTSNRECFSFMVQIARIQSQVTSDENIFRITSFVIQLLFLIYMRDHISKLDSYYSQRNISLSDYSIMLKNVPKQLSIQKKLTDFFMKEFSQPHPIKQVTLLPEYTVIQNLKEDKVKLINKLRKAYKTNNFTLQDQKNIENVKKIQRAIDDQITQSYNLAKNDELQCEKVILVFNTESQKQEIIKEFSKLNFSAKGPYFGVGADKIRIKQAPQPKEILWENVNVSARTKIFLYIGSWILSVFILVAITVVFYFLYDIKAQFLLTATQERLLHPDDQTYQTKYVKAIAIVYILLLFIIFFNKLIMSMLYHKITDIERSQTRSKFQFSFGLKYCLGLFFTTALMTLIVQAIVFKNYYSHPYGVVQQETVMFFLNAFLVPLFWLANPINLTKKITRKIKFGKEYLTQKQANDLMEQSSYQMGKRYAQIIQTIWFTYLYSTLVPIGAFISFAGLICYYWVDKYNLLRRSSLGGQVSGHLVMTSMKLIDFTLILKPVGELIFDIHMRQRQGIISTIVMIVVAFLYIVMPINKIINLVNSENFNKSSQTYDEIKLKFKDNYHSLHPILKIIHAQKHKKILQSTGINSKSQIRTYFLGQSEPSSPNKSRNKEKLQISF